MNQNDTNILRDSITKLSILSGILWIIIGYTIIHFFHDLSFLELVTEGSTVMIQLISGVSAGLLFGIVGVLMLRNPDFKTTFDDYTIIKELQKMTLSTPQILQISIVAGISEEILFRLALQPLLGIWLTSLIFIGIHGYIRFKTFRHILFTGFTFLLSSVLGVLMIYFGILAAIIAHTVYDIILLRELKKN